MTEANLVAFAQERYAALQPLNKTNNFYDYEEALELINYYTNNAHRMNYEAYKI